MGLDQPFNFLRAKSLAFLQLFLAILLWSQANQAIAGDWRMVAETYFCGSGATAGIQLQKAQSLKRRRRDSAINETLVRIA
jgi:predicted small integral membrane protein